MIYVYRQSHSAALGGFGAGLSASGVLFGETPLAVFLNLSAMAFCLGWMLLMFWMDERGRL